MNNLWGIDLGGTKVEGVILESTQSDRVLFRDRIATEAQHGYSHMVNQIAKLVDLMANHAGYRPDRIGIGTPGTLDPLLGVMKNCNTTALNGQPLRKDLEMALGMEVHMANDANCFALAEARLGVVRERFPKAQVVFGVIMGTGVGGGIVLNGHAWNGLQGIAGEWGHNYLDESGGPCYCGKSGCVEKVLAGPALERFYESLAGTHKSLKQIVADHLAGTDETATRTIERLTFFFGKAISALINTLDPDVVIIGGGVGNIDLIYSDGIDSLRKQIFNNRVDTPIVKPILGDSAGVFGAAFLAE